MGLLVAVALLGGQYGCSFADAPPIANRCENDGDCRTGTCNVDLAMCVTEVREPFRVGLEVLPETAAAGGTPILVSFPSFNLTPMEQEQLLLLPEPVRTSGLVRDTQTGEAMTATVTFNLRSAFEAGPSTRLSAQAVEEVSPDAQNRESNLTVSLLPGRDYDITVTPTGAWASRRPPLRIGSTYRSPSGSDSTFLDFLNYPDFCSSAITGDPMAEADCLVEMRGTVVDGDGAPQDRMIVRVVRAESGQLLSSAYTTGATREEDDLEAGEFRVVLPLAAWRANDWLYTVTPSAERIAEQGPSPTFSADPSSLFEVDGKVTILTPEVGNIVTYEGLVEDARGRPVANASVSFSAINVLDSETGVVGTFRTTVSTGVDDDAGRFEVQLLPGSADEPAAYDVVVTPEASSEIGETLRILRQTVMLGPEQAEVRGQVFEVPFRAQYGGIVRTPEALGFEDAQIRARPRGVDWMGMLGPIASLARSSTTVTDLDGVFNVNLDVGVYDVVVEPAGGSNYPWLVVPDQPIGGSDAPLNNVFELSAPVTMTGVARFEGTALAVGAEVRAYAIVESTDTTTRAIQIGRAVTDESGAFTLLLPPSI